MAIRVSRRKLAEYWAEQLLAGHPTSTDQLAAYLIDTKRTGEATLIARDVEFALLGHGVAVVDVTSARPLAHEASNEIATFIEKIAHAKTAVHLRTAVDATLLGGVKINLPSKELDSTLRRKLTILKARKV